MMVKVNYKDVSINMPYDLLEAIMTCEGLDDWIKNNPNSNYILNTVEVGII